MASPPPVDKVIRSDLSELVDAARGCPAMVLARRLAEWVGPGRELTASGVLRPAAAVEASGLLGIELTSAKPRSALDIEELMNTWRLAIGAGFIEVADRRVRTGPGLREWDSGDPNAVLGTWLRCTLESVGLAGEQEVEPRPECLTVLHALYERDGATTLDDLATAHRESVSPAAGDDQPCPDCGRFHGMTDPLDFLAFGVPDDFELVEDAVRTLHDFAAVALRDGAVELTALGGMLTTIMFRDSAPAPESDVQTLVTTLTALPSEVAATMARPWLNGDHLPDRVRELLAFAESASGQDRLTALMLAQTAGHEAAAVWREWSERPGFGAYARQWLAEQGEPIELRPDDEAWLTVDVLATALSAMPVAGLPPMLLTTMLREHLGADAAEVLPLLRASGHPAAEELVQLLGGAPATPSLWSPAARPVAVAGRSARPANDAVYQLKISLRGISKPPVWRRVLVPAAIRLGELHEVILRSMGWHGGHLHVFSQGPLEYGSPDPELGHLDEDAVHLSELLADPGDKLRYTYDFGDDWEHDVLLEKSLPPEPDEQYPHCLAGKGACPPEDCGGAWGYANLKEILADPRHEEHQDMLEWLYLDSADDFDPKSFSTDEVNTRLKHLHNTD